MENKKMHALIARCKKFAQGDLVEPTESAKAMYSNYALYPEMFFHPGMLGVVRCVDHELGGAQVEFFHPATGCMAACWTFHLQKIEWPSGDTQHPMDDLDPEQCASPDWWFCGSMGWRGALNYLKAVSILRPTYLADLDQFTLRIPGIHASRIRVAGSSEEAYAPACVVRESESMIAELSVV